MTKICAFGAAIVLIGVFGMTGCSTDRRSQQSYTDKEKICEYYYSGRYEKDVAGVMEQATRYFDGSRDKTGNFAIVFDIDETALLNWEYDYETKIKNKKILWGKWVESAKAPALKPVLDFFGHIKEKGAAVFFITGRDERYRDVTVKNLRNAGYDGWADLIMRSRGDASQTIAEFKEAEREKITKRGYRIIITVGDQDGDVRGGYAGKAFKLPGLLYNGK